jgi:membrane-bound ClpP family serine protease
MAIMTIRSARLVAAVFAWVLLSNAPAAAQHSVGLYVPVPSPITSDVVTRVKSQVAGQLDTQNASRPRPSVVVFDFNPDGKPAATPEIGACRNLAQFLRSIQGVTTTVAFVHGKVSGYSVLPVLACKELVMSKEGLLGEIVGEGIEPLTAPDKEYFKYYFARDPQFVLVEKMYDRDIKLRKGKNRNPPGEWKYVDARDARALEQLVSPQEIAGVQDGQVALYNAQTAKDVGLCKATAETKNDISDLYSVSFAVDPLNGRVPEAYYWVLKGEVDRAMRESVNRILKEIRTKNGNVLILVLNCGGNDLESARGIADDLRSAESGEDGMLIIGFIPDSAPAAATVVALGCSDIVMTKPSPDNPDAKEAEIGDFEGYLKASRPADRDANLASIRDLAVAQGYPGLLIDGMFNKDMEILRVTGIKNRTLSKLMTREEFEKNKSDWNEDRTVKPRGQLLKLKATRAAELGLARYTTEGTDIQAVRTKYGFSEVRSLDPSWLDRFADFLRMPVVTVLLVVIGFTGLILELKVPGLTVPGIIAALCFILVFWSQSRFSGQTFVLALLLFLMGLVLVGLEIFVLPGFGACGIFGILCMLGGLGLVTLERVPQTSAEWVGLGVKISQYLFAMMGAMGLAFFIARFLPRMPYANRLVLNAPIEDAVGGASSLPGAGEAAELLGAFGTTNTSLRPAGVVRFGEKFVDVVSDGGFIPAGTRVQVIQVEGTRIVVKEV